MFIYNIAHFPALSSIKPSPLEKVAAAQPQPEEVSARGRIQIVPLVAHNTSSLFTIPSSLPPTAVSKTFPSGEGGGKAAGRGLPPQRYPVVPPAHRDSAQPNTTREAHITWQCQISLRSNITLLSLPSAVDFASKICYDPLVCSEGRSFIGNDEPDKAAG